MNRVKKGKKLHPKILFFVEGETEETYFETLRQNYRLSAATVTCVLKCSGQDWVDKAKSKMNTNGKYRPSNNTQVYIIFDKDNFSTQNIQAMKTKVEKISENGIQCQLGISEKSFEVWLLAHFEQVTPGIMSQKQLYKELTNKLGNTYKKADPSQIKGILDGDRVYDAICNSRLITPFKNNGMQSTDIGSIVNSIIRNDK